MVARCRSLEPTHSTSNPRWLRWNTARDPQAVAVASDLFGSDLRVRNGVLQALGYGLTEVTFWGSTRPAEFGHRVDPVQYQLSSAARAFKVQALMAAAAPVASAGSAETFLTAR
jgi:hypothetical protein